MVYGYESQVTKGYANSNKNGFFAHVKDLLYALSREKPAGTRSIFVAHSLGGLLVKEVRFGVTQPKAEIVQFYSHVMERVR